MTTYSLGDRVLVFLSDNGGRSYTWQEAEVIEERGEDRVRISVDGKRRVVKASAIKLAPAPKAPPARVAPMLPPEPSDGVREALERHVGPRAVPKPPKPWRSQPYMAWIRTLSCCWCGDNGTIQAHHHGPHAMGQKTDDSRCIPLCVPCHRSYHDHRLFVNATGADTERAARNAQVACLRSWCSRHDVDADTIIVEALTAALRNR